MHDSGLDAITVTPGLVLAYVQGSRPRPYRVQVRLRTFDDADWDRFLDAAADDDNPGSRTQRSWAVGHAGVTLASRGSQTGRRNPPAKYAARRRAGRRP